MASLSYACSSLLLSAHGVATRALPVFTVTLSECLRPRVMASLLRTAAGRGLRAPRSLIMRSLGTEVSVGESHGRFGLASGSWGEEGGDTDDGDERAIAFVPQSS
jgi:hypothetical protein